MNLQDIQFNKKEPMYPQLSRYIKKLILADELKHYEELPSRRELALQCCDYKQPGGYKC